jgi:prevent-host-death family protein
MARAVTVYEAKTHLSRLLDEVEAGVEYVVTRNGIPCARIVPLEKPGKVPLGFVRGRVTDAFFEPLSKEELGAWEGAPPRNARARRRR